MPNERKITKAQDVERALEHLRSAEVLIERCKDGDTQLEAAHGMIEEAIEELEDVDAKST